MSGELAQMVERPLSMREVPGSIPGFSNHTFFSHDKSDVSYPCSNSCYYYFSLLFIFFCQKHTGKTQVK